jgi:hypothetical protein
MRLAGLEGHCSLPCIELFESSTLYFLPFDFLGRPEATGGVTDVTHATLV